MNTHKLAARTFGISFLVGYLSYGFGSGLLDAIINAPGGLTAIYESKYEVVFEAAVMMALFAMVNIVMGVIMTPIFKAYNQTISYAYLSFTIVATVLLIVGALFLLLLVPLSEAFATASSGNTDYFQTLFMLCKKGNFFAYQIGMVIWGIGGLFLCYLLYLSMPIPQWITVWGFIGYIIFIAGAFFALFGVNIDVLLDIPGGLFEIFLSFWLIIKGFNFSKAKVEQRLM